QERARAGALEMIELSECLDQRDLDQVVGFLHVSHVTWQAAVRPALQQRQKAAQQALARIRVARADTTDQGDGRFRRYGVAAVLAVLSHLARSLPQGNRIAQSPESITIAALPNPRFAMLKRRSFVRRLLLLITFLLLAAALSVWLLLRASLPKLDGQLTGGGLHNAVAIERDALGTATIRAGSRDDAMYALGFVHAQERYFEMDLMRRLAAGELAELVGSAAIDQDRLHRPLRMRARAE